jgi:hypothetical protein
MAASLGRQAQFIDGEQTRKLQASTSQQLDTIQKINSTLDQIVEAAERRVRQIA